MFGRLTWQALQHDWIEYLAGVSMLLGGLAVCIYLTYAKRWRWLFREWLCSCDHKKIGIMYLLVSFVMLVKGLIDAVMMRAQQMVAFGDSLGYLEADHYQQIFTAHGVTMVFFVGMGLMFALINLLLPLQIGARDVAFPFLNSLSFWLFASGAMFVLVSLLVGEFAGTGWASYPPLAGKEYSPGVGVDYWIWSIQISGIGSLLSGINFAVTILTMRCKGMTLMRMPVFIWSVLASMILVVLAFPILTATLSMLSTDRLFDTKLFTSSFGGNPMMYINLFWAWGHPEVYILVLPAFGVFSEVVPVFSKKELFGYKTMVGAIMGITVLSFVVWLHHFFTMGAGPNVNAFFGIMTMIIAVPTGVKVFNWIFTMCRGKVTINTAMLWFFAFIFTFVSGGMTGVMMSIPGIDFQTHNSLFLVAHFHSTIIGGVVFGFFAAYTYWFPKFTGFLLDETWGRRAFLGWFIGFIVAFFPLYLLGFMGVTRRLNHFEVATWQPWFVVASVGACIILFGVACQLIQIYASIRDKAQGKTKDDPWDGRTLEWMTASPPAFYNFAVLPEVDSIDAFWKFKQEGKTPKTSYEAIHMPKNTSYGFWIGVFSFGFGFGAIWHIVWLAALSLLGVIGSIFLRLFEKETDFWVSKEEVEAIEGGS